MALRIVDSNIDVVTAARKRIMNIFSNKLPVYLSFSGGKDSLCLANLTLDLIKGHKINPKQLTVIFIDEEAIYPCIEKTVLAWRKQFLLTGAKFQWWCVEVKHFNCFNNLTNDESFVCWDRRKKDVWIRQPPPFAIRSHPLLQPRIDTYQDFMARILINGISMVGVRASESIQRRYNFANIKQNNGMNGKYQTFPIYDWENVDVWLYLLKHTIDIPEIYMYMWQVGMSKNNLRVSQFFSIDTARCLVQMNEYYPDLMERVVRREPNAYLAALYWDSEMFGRYSSKRQNLEGKHEEKDYKALLEAVFANLTEHFTTLHSLKVAMRYRTMFLKFFPMLSAEECKKNCRKMYEALMAGDPKMRSYRAIYNGLSADLRNIGLKERKRR